jgi:hypothetical protein
VTRKIVERYLCVNGADCDSVFPRVDQKVLRFDPFLDYGLLLVQAGVFKSIKEAWQWGYKDSVPLGWNDFYINDNRVFIYNPREVDYDNDDLNLDLPWIDGNGKWQKGS